MAEAGWTRSHVVRVAGFAALLYAALVAALVGWLAWRSNTILAQRALENLATERRALLAEYQVGGVPRIAQLVAQRSQSGSSSLYVLVDAAGRPVAGNLAALPTRLADAEAYTLFWVPSDAEPERMAVGVFVPLAQGHRLLIARDVEDQRALSADFRRTLLSVLVILGMASAAAAIWLRRYLAGRIAEISETSRAIMVGDLSGRVKVSGAGGELDELAATLNIMLERIEHLMHALQEVSANIAHDLKTPLNRLRNSAESALRDPQGAPAYRRGLETTIEEADGLIRTFNALLLIARLEGGSGADQFESFEVSDIVRDVVELYEPVADEKHVQIVVTGSALPLFANRQLVIQALANLVDNAIKYACDQRDATPRRVDIAFTLSSGRVEITVADNGPGIAPSDRARALKRFVRLEESRSLPGSGLGLSLVSAVATLHGGTFRLEDNHPGLRAILSLPHGTRSARAA
jgi:signal transduction histidine kinase